MMDVLLRKKWSVIGIAVFCSLLWGSAFPVLKVSYEEFQIAGEDVIAKIVFAGLRFLLAGLLVLGFMLISNPKKIAITKKQFVILLLLGLVQTALQYFFFYNGLANVTGMQGAILSSGGTFFTVLLAHYFYVNDKMSSRKAVGLVAGFAGIIAANWGQGFSMSFSFTGEGFMILVWDHYRKYRSKKQSKSLRFKTIFYIHQSPSNCRAADGPYRFEHKKTEITKESVNGLICRGIAEVSWKEMLRFKEGIAENQLSHTTFIRSWGGS